MNDNLTAAILALVVAFTQLARELRRQAAHRRGELRERAEDRVRCGDD